MNADFQQVVEYYLDFDMGVLMSDFFSWTVTAPVEGELTIEAVVDRLGYSTSEFEPGPPKDALGSHELLLAQLGASIITFDYGVLTSCHRMREAFAGEPVRQWTHRWDIDGNEELGAIYLGVAGGFDFPPENDDWRRSLGPLQPYLQELAHLYDELNRPMDDDDEMDDHLSQATCMAIIEAESGIRLTTDTLRNPDGILRLRPEDATW